MADEQFHEFQLDGKQMVFLFMAATVVAVVIFLCGVMVGRGVRDNREQQAATQDALLSNAAAVLAGSATVRAMEAAAPTESPGDVPADPTAPLEPAPAQDERVTPRPVEPTVPPPTARATQPSAERSPRQAAEPPVARPPAVREPSARVYVVQVMSVTKRAEAEAAVRNLIGKGYDAFVSETREGGARYRVRVGRFTTRKDAVLVAARLEREEKFREPWVTQQ